MTDTTATAAGDWWRTAIIDIEPGRIRVRGYPIEQLAGTVGFAEMIWLMLRGELPEPDQAALLEAMLVSGVDHGPQAPSIAIARMAMTCGVGINNAMASATNVLGDVHGGAGEQLMELFADIVTREQDGADLPVAVRAALDMFQANVSRYVPGFGHRFHPVDPRGPRLLGLVEEAARQGTVEGRYLRIARQISADLERRAGRHLTMNIDGSGAVVLSELGFPPMLGRGLFVLSRSVGVLAHAWEQNQAAERNKGPLPRHVKYRYTGRPARTVPR